MRIPISAVLICLGMPAWAQDGNGADRAGGDDQASVASFLPKRIRQKVRRTFPSSPAPTEDLPLLHKGKCAWFFDCWKAPQEIEYDVTLKLVETPLVNYETESLSASYRYKGRTYPIQITQKDRKLFVTIQGSLYSSKGLEIIPRRHLHSSDDERKQSWTRLKSYEGLNSEITTWIDGVESKTFGEGLQKTLEVAYQTVLGQIDFNNLDSIRRGFDNIRLAASFNSQFDRQLDGFFESQQFDRGAGFDEYNDLNAAFVNEVQAGAQRVLELGLAAVKNAPYCDRNAYARMKAELETWSTGSPEFFIALQANTIKYFHNDTQIQAASLRQTLRLKLDQWVRPYCDPQATSRVGAFLNDGEANLSAAAEFGYLELSLSELQHRLRGTQWDALSRIPTSFESWSPEWADIFGGDAVAGVDLNTGKTAIQAGRMDRLSLEITQFHELCHLADPRLASGESREQTSSVEAEIHAWRETLEYLSLVERDGRTLPPRFARIRNQITEIGLAQWVKHVVHSRGSSRL